MKLFLLTVAIALLSACAQLDPNYTTYANIKIAEANAKTARYNAINAIGVSATDGETKRTAVTVLAMENGGGGGQSSTQAPQASTALQWAQILVPGLTQVAGIAANMRVATVQSNNAMTLGVSTNEAFVGIAGKIQAPGAVTTTTNTLAGTGTLGSGAYSTDSHNTDSHLVNPTPVTIVQPVVVVPAAATVTPVTPAPGTPVVGP